MHADISQIYNTFKSKLLRRQGLNPNYFHGHLQEAQRLLALAVVIQQINEELMMTDQQDIYAAFQNAMTAHDITPPDDIKADGHLHRFYVAGDRTGTRNGWYILHIDLIPRGIFGNWKTGVTGRWSAKTNLTWQERVQNNAKTKQKQQQYQASIKQAQLATAVLCQKRWERYQRAEPSHHYLVQKQIKPYCAKQIEDMLVLPIVDTERKIWSLQYITSSGQKVLCIHGSKKGHFIPVHNEPKDGIKILICEGFSTGASLADLAPDACVIAAIDAGNLASVATAVRQRWPYNDIVICADDDRAQLQNVGLIRAEHAAKQARARLIKPSWPDDAPLELSDFNDWVCWLNQRGELPCFVRF